MSLPSASPSRSAPRTHRPLATAAVLCGMAVSAIEMNIVGTAMPRIAGTLGGSDRFAWVISAYLLTSAVAAPLSGTLADQYGRKWVYQIAMALFLLGSVLSGAAPSMDVLIAARALQGLGGGALATVALTVVGDLYSAAERGRVQGLFSAVWGTAGAAGPLAGGFLVDHLGWRWVFYVNLPFGALGMVLLGLALHEPARARVAASLDWAGAGLLTGAVGALQLAGGERAGAAGPAGLLALAGAASLAGFVWVERRARAPLLPLTLLSDRLLGTAMLTSLLSGGVMFGLLNYVPLFVQGVQGASAHEAGAVITPLSVAWPVLGIVSGLAVTRIGPRRLIAFGGFLVALGGALLLFARTDTPRLLFLATGALFGAGMGLASTALLISVQSAVTWERRGTVTAAFSFCRTMGGTAGVIAAGTIAGHRLGARGISSSAVDALLRGGVQGDAAGAALVREALAYAVHGAFVTMTLLGVATWIAALAFPRTAALTATHESVPLAEP